MDSSPPVIPEQLIEEPCASLFQEYDRYRALIEDVQEVIFETDVDGRWTFLSPAWESLTGYTVAEAIGKSFLNYVYEADLPKNIVQFNEIRRTVPKTLHEVRYVRKDGSLRWVQVHARLFRDAEGRAAGTRGTLADVTERVNAEEALQRSQWFLDRIIEFLPIQVFVKSVPDLKMVLVNRAVEEMTGVPRTEMLGRTDSEYLPSDLAVYYEEIDRAVLQSDTLVDIPEERFFTRDGHERINHTRKIPITDTDGQTRYILGISEDITAQKEVEMALIRERDRAEEMNRLKDAFLSNMSHEIRTPLTSIIGFSEVLKEELGGQGGEFIDMIHSGAIRLLDTLNSVLDLAQLESRTLNLSPECVDLVAEARSVIDLFRLRPEKGALSMEVSAPPGGVCVEQDKGAIGRILTNLVSNAVKFTHQGRVSIDIRDEGSQVTIVIADTGEGIAEDFLPHLFTPFRQESTGPARNYGGNGLGLAITRQLLELLGGEISVESQKGCGTSFIVKLPKEARAQGNEPVR